MNNINSQSYWETRFSTGDWEEKKGRWQTAMFAKGQIKYLKIENKFEGTIIDFGCGLGDAIPVYKEYFPRARLIGVDHSFSAIEKCRKVYGDIATFIQGDYQDVPFADIIISSNVFEHLSDDKEIAKILLSKCNDLYIIVPYKEWPLFDEHVNSYDENYFKDFSLLEWKVFPCKGWSPFGLNLLIDVYLLNIVRFLLGKNIIKRNKQIILHFKGKFLNENSFVD